MTAADRTSFSPVLQTTSPLEAFSAVGVTDTILVAALDTMDDHVTKYDTLVFFDATGGIQPGPFSPPSTGPAYEKVDRHSSPFYLEGSFGKAGTAFFVRALAPDLSTVWIARYSANFIPRTPLLSPSSTVGNGIDMTQVCAVTSGPAANIYIKLAGRVADGTLTQSEYLTLGGPLR